MNLMGCGTALITPFRSDGGVDEPALRVLVNWQIERGIDFLVPCGTTGEASTLTEAEWLRTLEAVLQVTDGRIPVIAGCSGNATHEVVARIARLRTLPGLAGILSANPFYNRPGQEGQYRHFQAIADAAGELPLILYNIPSRTGANLEPATVLRLAEIPNIIGIKESSANLPQITELLTSAPRAFKVFAGDDTLALPIVALGAAGLISVASNVIPREMTALVHFALEGDLVGARKLNRHFFRLMQALFWEPSPAPIKALLASLGHAGETLRLPMVPVTPETRRRLDRLAGELGLFVGLPPGNEDLPDVLKLPRKERDKADMSTSVASGTLEEKIEYWFAQGMAAISKPEAEAAFLDVRDALEAGTLRAADPDPAAPHGWHVNAWVKRGILLGFRIGSLTSMGSSDGLSFVDKETFPARQFSSLDGIRIAPGGTSVRSGAYVSSGVVIMPPAYVNAGAYIDEGSMIDSHALVGSCAQIGKRVHLSAGAQIGGVLEPVNASPVVIEDDALIGGNTGVYEGTIVRRRAVLAAGTILTRGTPVYDLVHGTILRANGDRPLIIPQNAIVVPGARAVQTDKGREWGLSVATPVIVKYRDLKTELSLALEDLLR